MRALSVLLVKCLGSPFLLPACNTMADRPFCDYTVQIMSARICKPQSREPGARDADGREDGSGEAHAHRLVQSRLLFASTIEQLHINA